MTTSDTPEREPLTTIDALADAYVEADTPEEEPAEQDDVEAQAETEEPDEVEAEAEADENPDDEPDEQILDRGEYGDVKISMPDGSVTTLKDLSDGYLRQQDYSRKTQELADMRRSLDKQVSEAIAEQTREIEAKQQLLDAQLAQADLTEPDWAALAKEDPIGAFEQKVEWESKMKAIKDSQARQAQLFEQHRQQLMARTQQIALEKMPEWAEDPKRFSDTAAQRRAVAKAAGFTDDEYDATADFRMAVVLEKAARWDALQAGKPAEKKRIQKVKKVLKPGTSKTSVERKAAQKAQRDKILSKSSLTPEEYLKAMMG